jgi:hypothetical protein
MVTRLLQVNGMRALAEFERCSPFREAAYPGALSSLRCGWVLHSGFSIALSDRACG